MSNRITNKTIKEINPINVNDLSIVVFDKGNENPYKFPTEKLISTIQNLQPNPSLEDTINENPLSTLGFIVGTDDDNGTSIQQEGIGGIVNGSGTWGINNENGAAVFSTVSDSSGIIKPYKIYTALLTQNGTSAPTALILENTLGPITFAYSDVGSYRILSSNAFITNKTAVFTGQNYGNTGDTITYVNLSTESQLIIETYAGGVEENNNLFNTFIEIRVYN